MDKTISYTCPMHPEVKQGTPGKCPKCGMDLVREGGHGMKSDDEKFQSHMGHHAGMDPLEHHRMMAEDFKKRFFIVLPLTLSVLFLSPQIQKWLKLSLEIPYSEVMLFILGTVIAWIGGLPFYQAAKEELRTKNYGMMSLVSLAVLSGYLFSVAATFLFPGEFLWWEISTLVLAFLFGHWMEMRAVIGTGGALKELAKLIPDTAHKLNNNKDVVDVQTDELAKGDLVLVKPGERIPADGVVTDGVSSVDESMITGESRPISKQKDSQVIGGSINNDGSLTIKITKTGKESALAQIMELIRLAQNTKPKVQELADRAANVLTLTAITVGTGTFVYWFFINPQGAVFAATMAITVIVIACPHALGLAIPTVTTITSSLAARNGILIKDMKGLEVARNLDYIVLDKTGTLTEGKFGVSKIISKIVDERELVRLASAVELHSQHSIAQGVVAWAKDKKVDVKPATGFKSYPGKGAQGAVDNELIVIGNRMMMEDVGVNIRDLKIPNELVGTEVYVSRNKKLLGVIILEDKIREESKDAIAAFHKMGIKVAMLTGDKKEVGEIVGKKLNIDTVYSEVLPQDKVSKVKELQNKGYKVAMVGDGVNDAPSLTQAHVGIAIGAGTSVAIESAEIVLVKNSPLDIVKLIKLSRKTDAKMKQNLAWATGYNVLAIPAAAGVFYPWGITLRPEWGALLMSVSSLIVVANALSLKKVNI